MACSRLVSHLALSRSSPLHSLRSITARNLHVTRVRTASVEAPVVAVTPPPPPPPRKPIGAFRGTMFGFLLGATSAGAALYYYVIDDYRLSNQLLTEDLYALTGGVQRLEDYIKRVEGSVQAVEKKLRS